MKKRFSFIMMMIATCIISTNSTITCSDFDHAAIIQQAYKNERDVLDKLNEQLDTTDFTNLKSMQIACQNSYIRTAGQCNKKRLDQLTLQQKHMPTSLDKFHTTELSILTTSSDHRDYLETTLQRIQARLSVLIQEELEKKQTEQTLPQTDQSIEQIATVPADPIDFFTYSQQFISAFAAFFTL